MSDEETTPALFEHCHRTYQRMLELAEKKSFDGGAGGEGMVYEGFLTKLITEDLNLSTPYFTHVTGALKRMGCIKQLRRGGSSSGSQWLLVESPTVEKFEKQLLVRKKEAPKYATEGQFAALQQQLTAINQRVSRLERAFGMQ